MSDAGKPRPRAIISDFGGVLTTPLIESFAAYQRQSGITPEQLGDAMARVTEERDGRHPLHDLERGQISESDFLALLERALGGVSLREFPTVYFDALEPNGEMIELMRDFRRRGLRMALLTNNVREWEPRWRAMLPDIDEIFELVVDSAFVGMRKPEHQIYRLTLERLDDGLGASECVFVDDTEANCEAAREVGMQAVHFVDVRQARSELLELVG